VEFVKTLLEQQPMIALFLTIAIGYLVGELNIKGFSLAVGAVWNRVLWINEHLPVMMYFCY
jgi:hypothetical protein